MLTPQEPKKALLSGIKKLLGNALEAETSKAKFCSTKTAIALGKGDRPLLDLEFVVEGMWQRIATNWVESKCQWAGKENWRWELRKHLAVKNQSPEVRLNRELAAALPEEHWANEIPTGSGLTEKGGAAPGGLDLAYYRPPNNLYLIELKIDAENPVSAAFQIVTYALVLNLARLVHDRLFPVRKISEKFRSAKLAELRVLAPDKYFSRYRDLGWFEKRLSAGIGAFGSRQGLAMNFAFRRFDEKPTNERQLLAALNREVEWS